ncbi:MAG: radical SAM protein [Dehalococcoidales bacterium]|nr:radical SAM protein [Dehalococcoidales bacterium]
MSIAYGPVPSRRLGRSLGINNIPPKICSYSCIYCQLGKTLKVEVERRAFYQPKEIAGAVEARVNQGRANGEAIDYLTFVPDGEPTLDINLGEVIELLRPLGIKIAVITNSSLISRQDVRNDLQKADYVSLKVDAVTQDRWRRINRPHKLLNFNGVLGGMLTFASNFKGKLTTETMLIQGINDEREEIYRIADFTKELEPDVAYLAIPTRPVANRATKAAGEEDINMAYQIFKEKLSGVEYLIGYEGDAFSFTGNIEDDLLSITSVHPMRVDAVKELLKKANSGWETIDRLIGAGRLVELEYNGKRFYMRKLPNTGSMKLNVDV